MGCNTSQEKNTQEDENGAGEGDQPQNGAIPEGKPKTVIFSRLHLISIGFWIENGLLINRTIDISGGQSTNRIS